MADRENHVHNAAAVGFQDAAEVYDRGRPDYPAEAISFISRHFNLGPETNVTDLGAGTGKFTSLIAPTGASITTVEPVEAMRERLKVKLPSITTLSGTAQEMPLGRSSQDIVFAAQAFHWFANEASLSEIRRVLKPNGTLVLIWNVRDESVPWVRELTKIIEPYQGDTPRFRTGEWRKAIEYSSSFGDLQFKQFPYQFTYSADGVIDRFLSVSFIAALPQTERESIASKITRVVEKQKDTSETQGIVFPYRTEVYWTPAI